MRIFGAQYQNGRLNHPKLANQRRAQILGRAEREFSRDFSRDFSHDVDRGMDAVLKLTALISDPALTNAVKSRVDNLKDQHVRKLMHLQMFGA